MFIVLFSYVSAHMDAVFFVYLMLLVDKILLSKHKICVMLKLFPDISIMLENICVIKISLVSELAVKKVL